MRKFTHSRIGRITVTLLLAVALATHGGFAKPVMAQTIEELKAQIQALAKKLEELEINQRALEAAQAKQAGESAKAEASAAAPAKKAVSSGSDRVELSLSGQVNRGVLYVDNGGDQEVFHVDNDNSSTRVRFIGKGRLNEDVSIGSQIEVEFESNSTDAIRIDQERKLELYGDSKRFGRLWVGQGDTASNGTSEADLSGTSVIAYSDINDMSGGIAFQDGGVLGPRINQVFSNFDGLSRDDRLRYDTPNFGGFTASASAVDGDIFDVAARFAGEVGDTKIAAAIGYANGSSRTSFDDQINGSLSLLTTYGISLTAAAGLRDMKGRSENPATYYGKLAYTFDGIEYGVTFDFALTEDLAADGDEATSYGAFLVQNLEPVATQLYLGVRNHALDRPGGDFDDLFAILTGARVKF
jgi:predicted porin